MKSVTEVAAKIGISRKTVHAAIARGDISPRRIGSQYVLSDAEIGKIKKRPRGRPRKCLQS